MKKQDRITSQPPRMKCSSSRGNGLFRIIQKHTLLRTHFLFLQRGVLTSCWFLTRQVTLFGRIRSPRNSFLVLLGDCRWLSPSARQWSLHTVSSTKSNRKRSKVINAKGWPRDSNKSLTSPAANPKETGYCSAVKPCSELRLFWDHLCLFCRHDQKETG